MPPKEQSKAAIKAQKAKAKKEKQLLDAKMKDCEEKCAEAKGFLQPSGRSTEPNYAKAKAALDAAVEAFDASPLPFFLLGQWNRLQGMLVEAIESYSHALDLDPTDVQALEWRGNCYQTLRDYPHAIEDNTSVITLDPENDHAYNMRGLCVLENCVPGLRLKTVDFEACISDFSAAIRLNEANYYAMANLGKAYEVQGNNEKAMECYGRALRVNEAYTYARFRRGCTALRVAEDILCRANRDADEAGDDDAQEGAAASTSTLAKATRDTAGTHAQDDGTKGPAHREDSAMLEEIKLEVCRQFEEERAMQTSSQLLKAAEGDFAALLNLNPDANKATEDVMVVLNIGICALLRKDIKKASEFFKLVQEILTNRPTLVEDGEAAPIENAESIKRVLAIRQKELEREKDRIRSAAAA